MKFTKSSRILAIVLAVVMILPLISVMAFAEGEGDAASNVIFSADFEGYTLTDGKFALDAKDATFNQAAPNGNKGCKYGQGNEVYTSSGNYVVKDPKATAEDAGKGQVWEMPIHENLDNNNFRMNFTTEKGAVITVYQDVLVPADAVGTVQYQFNGSAGNFKYWMFIVAGADGSLAVDLQKAAAGLGDATNSKESLKLERDVWNNIAMQFDTTSGAWVLYINGNEAAYGVSTVFANQNFTAMYVAKPFKASNDKDTYKGKWYFDNFVVEKGEYKAETLWSADFDSFTLTDGKYRVGAEDANGPIWKKNPNDGKNADFDAAKIVADPAGVAGNQVYAFNNWAGTKEQAAANKAAGDNNWDNNNNIFNVPAVSYKNYQAITWSFDIYVPKDATASLLWQWAGSGTKADGTNSGSKTWNDFLYIQFTAGDDNAYIKLFTNNAADDSSDKVMKSIKKETWTTIAASWDLVKGELTVYVNGEQAFRGYYTIQANGLCTQLELNAGALYGPKLEKTSDAKNEKNAGWTYFDNMEITVGKKLRKDIVVAYPEGTYYLQDFQGFKAEQSIAKNTDVGFIADSKVVEEHKAFADPKKADNIVWWRPLDDKQGTFDDPWAKLDNVRVDYKNNPVVDLTTDYYLPKESTGYFQVQLYGSASGTNNYFHLWDINVTDGLLMEHYDGTAPFKAKAEGEDAFKLPRDEWFTIRTIIDLPSGTYDVFLNGKWVAAGHIRNGDSKIVISAKNLDVSCLRCSDGNKTAYKETEPTYVQSGYVLIDNIKLTEFKGSVIKVTADGLADGVLGTKVDDKLLEAGVHLFEEAKTATEVAFDKTPYAKLFKSTVGEFRLNADEGIRFVTELDAALLTQLLADKDTSEALVKKGTIILPADYVKEDVALTADALTAAGIEFLDVVYADAATEYEANKMAGSIYKIKTNNYDRDFVAVPYVQVTLPHGNTMTLYGEASAPANAAELAAAALADTTATFNGTEKALLEEYAAKVSAE